MNAIHIRKKLESDTLHLPELHAWVGKTVDITVQESGVPTAADWAAALQAANELEDYDFDAFQRQRDYDVLHAPDQQP